MTCPEKLQAIILKELSRQKEKNLHPRLLYRKDSLNIKPRRKSSQSEIEEQTRPMEEERADPKEENMMLQEWYDFHCQLDHQDYRDFYSKILFCLNKELVSNLDTNTFLELIADRCFLFLDYNENYSIPCYQPLSEIVHAPNSYLRSTDPEDGEETEYERIQRQNAEIVLQQIFVPSKGHQRAWEKWREHQRELRNACALQKMLAEECGTKAETVEIQIDPALQMSITKREEKLCELFRKYVEACYQYAYAEDMKETLGRGKYQEIIQYVDHYLQTNYAGDPIFQSLVFFHLFSQQMKRVAKGSLRKYCCKPLQPSKLKNQRPIAVQSTVRTRVECNIKLFDYLMELLLFDGDKDRSHKAREEECGALEGDLTPPKVPILTCAKYRFRLFTQYDRYCHYDMRDKYVNNEKTGTIELQIDFRCRENPKDGVDLFGNLLRYHIRYCMPNQVQWLQPFATQVDFTPILATLLLDDGQIMPTRERLTDRIRHMITYEKDGHRILEQYEKHFLDQKEIQELLISYCDKCGFHFRHEDALYERDYKKNSLEIKAAVRCGRIVLDYEIREELIRRAEKNLLARAEELFGDLCNYKEENEHSS